MDIATIIGLLAGIALVVITILLGGAVAIFWNVPSFVLVVGGTLAATLINFPLSDVLSVFNTLKNAFIHRVTPPEKLIEKMVHFATVARREGILALESHAAQAEDEFLQRSIQLAIDGTAPELIKDILTTEIAFMEDRHGMGQSILITMGTFAPAFGMIGTLMGLVAMLRNMDDPKAIGPGMAVAILTTFYGAMIANVLCLPLSDKLSYRNEEEMLLRTVMMKGILSLQAGDNPRITQAKLAVYLPADKRTLINGVDAKKRE